MNMKIGLLAMPFLLPQFPSLGLTQMKYKIKKTFNQKVDVRLFYLNHDFYNYLGSEMYKMINAGAFFTLANEWLFRHEAFDHIKPNYNEYIMRFYPRMQFEPDVLGKIMNLGAFIQQLIAKYQLATYDIIGINATFSVVPGLAFFRHLKRRNNNIITVMGGACMYQEMGKALIRHYPHVDYVCSGSGLISFPRLIEGFMKNDEHATETINGMFSRKNMGKVGNVSDEQDIHENISLDYQDFFENFKKLNLDKHLEPNIFLETSRGCYWRKCKFCGLNEDQLKYRVKPVETAIEEINHYIKKYDSPIQMVDNVIPRHYIKKVLPHLRVPEGKYVVYEVRGDLSEEEIKILSQAKVNKVQPGFESLQSSIHDLMCKGINAFQCINMLKCCVKYSISPGWNLLIGFPDTTAEMYETLLTNISLLTHLFPPQVLTPVRFDRYSVYWMEKERYGLKLFPFSPYKYIYPYDDEFLSDIAYYFVDQNLSKRTQLLGEYYPKFDTQINQWKKRWQTDINNLPRLTCYYKDGSPYIYDSRGEEIKEYKISLVEETILKRLDEPMSDVSIKDHFPDIDPEIVAGGVTHLIEKGMIFKEGNQVMSLVIFDYPDTILKPGYL